LPAATAHAIPASGNGGSQLFTISVENRNGLADVRSVQTMINGRLTGSRSCLVAYDQSTNTLRLADDAGSGWSAPLRVGGNGRAANSQCAVHGVGSSVTADVNRLSLVIPITFDARFAGAKTIYGAVNTTSTDGNWQSLGSWTVPSAHAPAVAQTSLSGSGSARTFTFSASAAAGSAGISAIEALINSALGAAGSCFIRYDAAAETLQLADDRGTGWSSPVVVGSAGTMANSQCTVRADGSSALSIDDTLTAAINITFDASFAGVKTIYGLAEDAGGDSSNWQSLGTWIVPSAAAPSVSLASAPMGTGVARTLVFTASIGNRAAPIAAIQAIVNSALSVVGSCFVAYDATANTLLLADDGGTGWSPPIPVGSTASISNSQCTVHGTGSLVSTGPGTLTVAIPITTGPGFDGSTLVYGLSLDAAGGSSQWQSVGSWNPSANAPGVIRK
jgi:hypothetical protein